MECRRKSKGVIFYGKLFQHCGGANVKKMTVKKKD